ncbi:hypothetical protein H1C71_018402, partial [Ictidomys tridecemlineatus]
SLMGPPRSPPTGQARGLFKSQCVSCASPVPGAPPDSSDTVVNGTEELPRSWSVAGRWRKITRGFGRRVRFWSKKMICRGLQLRECLADVFIRNGGEAVWQKMHFLWLQMATVASPGPRGRTAKAGLLVPGGGNSLCTANLTWGSNRIRT